MSLKNAIEKPSRDIWVLNSDTDLSGFTVTVQFFLIL